MREANHYLNSYKKVYPGIPRYWNKAIARSQESGYAESLSGRRYGITSSDWVGQSSSINMPIQGSGADLAEIAISSVHKAFPDVIFQIQVHDSMTWIIPESMDPLELQHFLNNKDYAHYFGRSMCLTFPLDCAVGVNLGEMSPL